MKKIGLLVLVLVLALGTVGTVSALWSETLYITGTVTTGDIDLDWTVGNPTDDETKDVSHAEAYINGDTLVVTIYNAYPCITYTIPIDLHGVGSVPVHTSFEETSNDLPSGATLTFPTIPEQIHQGDTVDGNIVVHLNNNALENHTYSFTATLHYWQYNETGP